MKVLFVLLIFTLIQMILAISPLSSKLNIIGGRSVTGDDNLYSLEDDPFLDKNHGNTNDNSYQHTHNLETLKVVCDVNGNIAEALIDTGAQVSIMSTNFAKRCGLSDFVDKKYSGRAVGVGSSQILGKINNLPIRLSGLNFKCNFSILQNSRVDFILGLDVLRKFKTSICLRENIIKMYHRNKVFRIPILSSGNLFHYEQSDEESEGINNFLSDDGSFDGMNEDEGVNTMVEEDEELVSMEGV